MAKKIKMNGEAPRTDLRAALAEDAQQRGQKCLDELQAACAANRCEVVAWPTLEPNSETTYVLGARFAVRPLP